MRADEGVGQAFMRTPDGARGGILGEGQLPPAAAEEAQTSSPPRSRGRHRDGAVALGGHQIVYHVADRLVAALEQFLDQHVTQVSRIGFSRPTHDDGRDPSREALERMCGLSLRALSAIVHDHTAPTPESFSARLLALRVLTQVEAFYRLSFPNRRDAFEASDVPGSPDLTIAAINLKALLLGTQISLQAEAAGVSVGDVEGVEQ